MISTFNNRTVVIRRLKAESYGKSYYATATVEGNIQNVIDKDSNSKQGIATKTYKGYFEVDTDIQVNDRLTDDQGRNFRVMAVEKLGDNLGISSEHLEVILDRPEA